MSARIRIDGMAARAVLGLPAAVLATLLIVAAWRLATWLWVFAPSPAPVFADRQGPDGGGAAIARHWFGAPAPTVAARGAPGSTTNAPAGGLALAGVISGGKRSAALIADGNARHEVLVGETFGPGLKLQAVAADHVVIDRQGTPVRLELQGAASGPVSSAVVVPPANAAPAETPGMAPLPPAEYPGRRAGRPAKKP